ncbi:MAG: transcriptional regulator [Pseudorhizobium sp.]
MGLIEGLWRASSSFRFTMPRLLQLPLRRIRVGNSHFPAPQLAAEVSCGDTITNADAPAVVETYTEPKKQRKPRTKKVSLEKDATDTAIETGADLDSVGGQKKRGLKPKAVEGAAVAKRSYVKRAPKDEQPEAVVATSAGDAMADILQLEEENQKLRKLLADKLRAENGDLRNRLNLG